MSDDTGKIDPLNSTTQVDAEDVKYAHDPLAAVRQESVIVAPPGGIMTNDVGVVTGDVAVKTEQVADGIAVTVSSAGSPDPHTVSGSPLTQPATHDAILEHLATDRGPDADGNPRPTDVSDLQVP